MKSPTPPSRMPSHPMAVAADHRQPMMQWIQAADEQAASGTMSTDIDVLEPSYEVIEGVAVVDIHGYILPTIPYVFMRKYATGMDQLTADLMTASMDTQARAILLRVSSPGGVVAGVESAADAITRAGRIKPLAAHVDGLCASAAYWLASQAGYIAATETSEIGSIGVYMVADDWSRLFENAGIQSHVIASAERKTGGDEFSERPTARQLANHRELVTKLADMFVGAVARGRGVSPATAGAWATGDVWLTPDAIDKGLADVAEPFMQTLLTLSHVRH